MGFAMQDSPLDHPVPYPASGSHQYLYRENRTHVVSSDDINWCRRHWQNWPCHWFCNSSRLWLTRHSNKHAVTIPTREGAGAAVIKAEACEMWAAGAGGNGTCQPPKWHFWGALFECGTGAAATHHGCAWHLLCTSAMLPAALTDTPCAGGAWQCPRRGYAFTTCVQATPRGCGRKWVEVLSPLSPLSHYYLHIPVVQAGTKEDW